MLLLFAFVKNWFFWFSDLKLKLQRKTLVKKEHPTSVKYYDEIANSLTEALYSTIRLLDEEKLNEAIKMITQSKTYIYLEWDLVEILVLI